MPFPTKEQLIAESIDLSTEEIPAELVWTSWDSYEDSEPTEDSEEYAPSRLPAHEREMVEAKIRDPYSNR